MLEVVELFSNSLVAIFLLSVAVGLIGPLLLLNRYNYLTASIAHGSYGGIGLALYLGIPILLGATLFALLLALLLAVITFKEDYPEILISLIWAVGMSVGIIFVDLTSGYQVDLLAYLFGDILLVAKEDLVFMGIIDLVLIFFIVVFKNHLLALAYDREFAILRGLRVKTLHTLTLMVIALVVVMSIHAIGLILVIALFSLPPYIAQKFTNSYLSLMVGSGVITLFISLIGFFIAYSFNLSTSASIILSLASLFLVVKGFR